jgi:hypothetical protein
VCFIEVIGTFEGVNTSSITLRYWHDGDLLSLDMLVQFKQSQNSIPMAVVFYRSYRHPFWRNIMDGLPSQILTATVIRMFLSRTN